MSRSWKVPRRSAALLVVLVAACSKGKSAADTPVAAVVIKDTGAAVAVAVPADQPVALQVATTPGGVILTDASGHAVYIMEGDAGGPGACTGDCASQFTPVSGSAMPASGQTDVKASMAGSTTKPDGSKQATYNGQPLYYYKGDQASGDTKGEGAKAGSATGYLVSPEGKKVEGKGAKK
jgi:predicted lipoprotein with Yx(FWY)xxD motif